MTPNVQKPCDSCKGLCNITRKPTFLKSCLCLKTRGQRGFYYLYVRSRWGILQAPRRRWPPQWCCMGCLGADSEAWHCFCFLKPESEDPNGTEPEIFSSRRRKSINQSGKICIQSVLSCFAICTSAAHGMCNWWAELTQCSQSQDKLLHLLSTEFLPHMSVHVWFWRFLLPFSLLFSFWGVFLFSKSKI